jgi:hypothetical protein
MRRSQAPSQIAKSSKRQKLVVINKIKGSDHEALIQKILSKPYKCPIPGWKSNGPPRALGPRKSTGRRAVHDHDSPNALVLYTPDLPPPGVLQTVSYFLYTIFNAQCLGVN